MLAAQELYYTRHGCRLLWPADRTVTGESAADLMKKDRSGLRKRCVVLIQTPIPSQSGSRIRCSRKPPQGHLRHRPLREQLKAVSQTTMLELDRPSGEAQGAVIRYGVGVDCEVEGEVMMGFYSDTVVPRLVTRLRVNPEAAREGSRWLMQGVGDWGGRA